MKKVIAITIAAVITLGIVFLTGCGGNDVKDNVSDAMTTSPTTVDSGNNGSNLGDDISDAANEGESIADDVSGAMGDDETSARDTSDESSTANDNTSTSAAE